MRRLSSSWKVDAAACARGCVSQAVIKLQCSSHQTGSSRRRRLNKTSPTSCRPWYPQHAQHVVNVPSLRMVHRAWQPINGGSKSIQRLPPYVFPSNLSLPASVFEVGIRAQPHSGEIAPALPSVLRTGSNTIYQRSYHDFEPKRKAVEKDAVSS